MPAGWAVLPTHRMAVVDGEGVEEEREEGGAVQHSCATLTMQGELAGGKEKGRCITGEGKTEGVADLSRREMLKAMSGWERWLLRVAASRGRRLEERSAGRREGSSQRLRNAAVSWVWSDMREQ